ncbi:PA2169 family four-helix-bundle protein [Pedobacter sp. PLR]|uniref:PA2169 family four-helix-bundle protein n=1 Tax=Pedobacter sp. PLR TaxID=2994465 RepID=UPI002246CD16|nr:PA2169 family four-helix-bundle protein [Pedobacter sp. PLR]MCX2453451.1 PA2169 family four-helix-bundle protein [Pedobacter sp. PLR]
MENNKVNLEILNDLIEIHNDRILDYEKAIDELEERDADLIEHFNEMIQESHQLKADLKRKILSIDDQPTAGTSTAGKVHHAWLAIKIPFTGPDRESILSHCEFWEVAAQKAYQTALKTEGLYIDIRRLLTNQQARLTSAHHHIKILSNQIV